MPRYLVERDFPDGLIIPPDGTPAHADTSDGVIWVHSYVSTKERKSYCVYDGPSCHAVQSVAAKGRLPVARISEIRLLGPNLYC